MQDQRAFPAQMSHLQGYVSVNLVFHKVILMNTNI